MDDDLGVRRIAALLTVGITSSYCYCLQLKITWLNKAV